jgi:hypothetical protein
MHKIDSRRKHNRSLTAFSHWRAKNVTDRTLVITINATGCIQDSRALPASQIERDERLLSGKLPARLK